MPLRVLVVDDDPAIRRLVTLVLHEAGFEVSAHENGSEALKHLAAGGDPDLVLLDMRMPVMDGWEFASELTARRINVPIVVMTAAMDASSRAREIDAKAWISKPFDIDELLDVVRGTLGIEVV